MFRYQFLRRLCLRSSRGSKQSRVCTRAAAVLCLLIVSGCAWLSPKPPGIGRTVGWKDLPGWNQDQQAQAWPPLMQSCGKRMTDPVWAALCQTAQTLVHPDDATARRFFETWFVPYETRTQEGRRTGLITGYYEPLLNGSLAPSERFRYPLYRPPPDLVTIDLGGLYPELQGKRLRGRLRGNHVVPYYSRSEIDAKNSALQGQELLWVDDPIALFFLQIQGSGLVRLPDGKMLGVSYADQNGHPYNAIGKCLVARGVLAPVDTNLFTIRAWLQAHPDLAQNVFNCNPSYVFFSLRDLSDAGGDEPLGALQMPLTPQRSIAVDPAYIPLGAPVWLSTTLPIAGDTPYQRLVFAQDTGGAIKGPVRADLFWGAGDYAEQMAGLMKQPGKLFVLRPRAETQGVN